MDNPAIKDLIISFLYRGNFSDFSF